jgi:rare lipoprotein A
MVEHTTSRLRRTIAAAGIAAAVALTAPGMASGHGVTNYWQYRPDVRSTTWRSKPTFEHRHRHFHRNVQRRQGALRPARHRNWHHTHLVHAYREAHYYRRLDKEAGEAAWYEGDTGACGKPLVGMYAAHKTWPCGSLVSVKHGSRYVFVRILDRGPYTQGRVIDLSPAAFNRLGDTSSGTMDVRIYRIKRDR